MAAPLLFLKIITMLKRKKSKWIQLEIDFTPLKKIIKQKSIKNEKRKFIIKGKKTIISKVN